MSKKEKKKNWSQNFLTIHQAMFPTKSKTCKKNRMLTPRISHKTATNKQ